MGEPVQDSRLRATPFARTISQLSRSLRKPEHEEEIEGWRHPGVIALGQVALLLAGPSYPRGNSCSMGSSWWRVRTSPVSQDTDTGKAGSGLTVVSLLLTACYPIWPYCWDLWRLELGQSFRGWFLFQTITRDGANTAKMLSKAEPLCILTVRDIPVTFSQTLRPWLNVLSLPFKHPGAWTTQPWWVHICTSLSC